MTVSLYGAFETTVVVGAVLGAAAYARARWFPKRRSTAPGCDTGCASGCGTCGNHAEANGATSKVIRLVRRR